MNKYSHREELLAGLRDKDLSAFEEIFFKYHGRLVLFAHKFIGDIEVARDIVQDAFMILWEKSETITINDSPKSYLFQTVKNRALNYNRHLQVRQSSREELVSKIYTEERKLYSDDHDPFISLLEMEMEQKIERVLNQLPEKCQTVFRMSRKEHLKNKEIAAKMEISVKMVEKYISKALQILRLELSDYMGIILFVLFQNL